MSKKSLVVAAIALCTVAAAFALNPSPQQHRAKVKQAIGENSPLAGLLGLGALAAFASTYQSFGVVSYTTVDDHVLSVGAFGLVVVRAPKLKRS